MNSSKNAFFEKSRIQIMNTKYLLFLLFSISFFSGCSTTSVSLLESGVSKPNLDFIDIAKFDRDMAASLADKYEAVEVKFYEKVSPNSMPERLQNWLSSVEKTGGKVEVKRPEGEPIPKDAFSLISLASTLFSFLKSKALIPFDNNYKSAKDRNAIIQLERNKEGNVVVSSITFVKTK